MRFFCCALPGLFYRLPTLNSQLSPLTYTQGVAIGLDLFKPFQGFSIGYQLLILNSHLSILISPLTPPTLLVFSFYLLLYHRFSPLTFTQGVAIGLDMFKPFQGFSIGYQLLIINSQLSTLNSQPSTLTSHPAHPFSF